MPNGHLNWNFTRSLNLSFTDLEWEAEFRETELTEVREGIQLSNFSATIEEFREDRRHLSDPAYSIILLCYFLVLILAGLVTFTFGYLYLWLPLVAHLTPILS